MKKLHWGSVRWEVEGGDRVFLWKKNSLCKVKSWGNTKEFWLLHISSVSPEKKAEFYYRSHFNTDEDSIKIQKNTEINTTQLP